MRAELRQAELAALLHLSQRTIHNWENGEAYPSEVHLRQLLALAQQRGLFSPGREHQEAAHLWTLVGQHTAKPLGRFDPAWFASLPHPQRAAALTAGTSLPAAAHDRLVDWGEAPDTSSFHGRTQELATLRNWIGAERVRLVALLGMGGIGKTSLAAQLARELAAAFEAIYWRSLRNAPPVQEWLAGALGFLRLAPPHDTHVAPLALASLDAPPTPLGPPTYPSGAGLGRLITLLAVEPEPAKLPAYLMRELAQQLGADGAYLFRSDAASKTLALAPWRSSTAPSGIVIACPPWNR